MVPHHLPVPVPADAVIVNYTKITSLINSGRPWPVMLPADIILPKSRFLNDAEGSLYFKAITPDIPDSPYADFPLHMTMMHSYTPGGFLMTYVMFADFIM